MLKSKIMFLVPGVILGVAAAAAGAAGPISADQTVPLVNIGRQAAYGEQDKLMQQANAAFFAGKYDQAIQLYIKVKKGLEKSPSGDKFKRKIESCNRGIQNSYLRKAQESMKKADSSAMVGDFEQAIRFCRDALEFCPEQKSMLESKIKLYEKRRTAAKSREDYSIEKLEPDLKKQEYQIELLIEQGRALVSRNELMKARRKFEEALLVDPYNPVATQNLLAINHRIQDAAKLRANATARHFMGKTEWDAAIPVVRDIPVGEPVNQIDAPVVKVVNNSIEKKLKTINIRKFDFEKLPFAQVMQTLNDAIRRADPDRRGINLVIKDRDLNGGAEELVLDTYSKNDITPIEILEDLKNSGFLTYKVDQNAVFVAAKDVPLEQLEVRIFAGIDVPKDLHKDDKMQEYLASETGVRFDSGCYARVKGDHVVACHTPENLKLIGESLNKLSSQVNYNVQVMFKFIEVAQKDLDELAFNWQYARGLNNEDVKNSFGSNTSNTLLRHYGFGDGASDIGPYDGSSYAGNTEDAQFNFGWADKKNALIFSVYALDWADQTTVLYAPRVTTLSGQTATINMTEKHYYPDEWETIDSENSENAYVYVDGAQPDLSDEQELGVKFQVRPTIHGDPTKRASIHVPVVIPIKQFYDWLLFNNTVPPVPGRDDDDDGEFIKKPIFTLRTVNTELTVLDGETVMVASISNDVIKTVNDKIPILGDLPLIGRLFQARYTNSQKINLMIFMTCQIIKPDGSPASELVNQGLPKFPHNQ